MIIQRYLLKEIMLSFLGTLFILLLIIIGSTFVRLLSDVSSGSLPVEALGKLVFTGSINGAIQLTPITLLKEVTSARMFLKATKIIKSISHEFKNTVIDTTFPF